MSKDTFHVAGLGVRGRVDRTVLVLAISSPGLVTVERIRRLPLDAPLWETQIAPLSLASIPIDALAVDACGLGASVAEQLESELPYLVFPTITTGSGDKPVYNNGRVYVSKTELIKTLMLAVNRGAVRVTAPKHEADILKKDMLNFRVQQTRTGLRLEAAAGAKDDAVLAYARAFMAGAIARQQHLTQAQDKDDAVLAYARAFMAGAIARQQHLTQAQDMDM